MSRKNPLFVCLDDSTFGTFVKMEDKDAEEGYVFVWYVPFNSIRQTMYPRQIKRSDIHSISAPTSKTPGIEPDVRYVYNGKENSLLKKIIGDLNKKTIEDLTTELNNVRLKLSMKEQDLRDNSESVEKSVKRATDIRKAAKSSDEGDNNSFNKFKGRFGGI